MDYFLPLVNNYLLVAIAGGIAGYLFGSINFAIVFCRLFKRRDIRDMGSGNPGATNMLRAYGLGAGIVTFVCDVLKGVVAVIIADILCRQFTPNGVQASAVLAFAGLCSVLGHMFPVFFGFKGGKGVSAGFGFLLAFDWRIALICIALFAVVTAATRLVSLGSVISAIAAPLVCFLLCGTDIPAAAAAAPLLVACILIIIRHRQNIVRIFEGKENRLTLSGKKNR